MVLETGGEDSPPGFPPLLRTEQAGGGHLFGNCGDSRRESIVEKRKRRRVSVQGDVSGRALLVANLDIRDLSLNGIRFLCRERVAPTSRIHLAIQKDGLQVRVEGTVVRAALRNDLAGSASCGPMYEVGVAFGSMEEEAHARLERIVTLRVEKNHE